MCGIAGVVGSSDRRVADTAVRAMMEAQVHRGPDAEGHHGWDGAVLGHRRLSIFDLSDAGRQPFTSPDGTVGVVFNGAIYNFPELRAELERSGRVFRSHTDTEVLVHGYQAWGIDVLLARLRGMFAIALWDSRTRTLYLVRDRLGVKPLVYTEHNGVMAFSSTVRALSAAGLVGDLDAPALAEYLEFGYVTDERAIYAGVRKVPAATLLEWRDGRATLRSYWQPPTVAEAPPLPFEDAVAETERLLLRAVERRLFADVPVGALLSGGIDSSLVCWAIAHLEGDVTAFTVGTPGDPWDETATATATARALGIKHVVLPLSPDESPTPADLASAYGEPFACASALGMLSVSRLVKSRATVLLTGDGGDDVFLGYPEHRHFWAAQRTARMLPELAGRAWKALRPLVPPRGGMRRAGHFLDYATGGLGAVATAHDGWPTYERLGLLGPRLREVGVAHRALGWSAASARSLLVEFLEYDRRGRFVAEFMTKVDGATMYHALEARSPFLDQDLWEFAARLPFEVRLRGGQSKAILRALARRRIGPEVADGRKRGFGVPVQRWITGRWRATLQDVFSSSVLEREGWVSGEAVRRHLARLTPHATAPNQLWYLFVLEMWMRSGRGPTDAQQHSHRVAVSR